MSDGKRQTAVVMIVCVTNRNSLASHLHGYLIWVVYRSGWRLLSKISQKSGPFTCLTCEWVQWHSSISHFFLGREYQDKPCPAPARLPRLTQIAADQRTMYVPISSEGLVLGVRVINASPKAPIHCTQVLPRGSCRLSSAENIKGELKPLLPAPTLEAPPQTHIASQNSHPFFFNLPTIVFLCLELQLLENSPLLCLVHCYVIRT